MKFIHRICLLTVLIYLVVSPSWAMEHYINTVQDRQGNALPGTKISVYLAGTTTLAELFSVDDDLTTKANPFFNEANGLYEFFAANAAYDITFYRPGTDFTTANLLYRNIRLFDETDFSLISPALGLDGNFDLPSGNIITGSSESKRLEVYGTGPQAGNGGVSYQRSDGEWIDTCIVATVENDCDKNVRLNSGKQWRIIDDDGNTQVVFDNDTGAFTTLNAIVAEEAHYDVAGCQASTAGAIYNLPTANAPAPTCEGSNTRLATLDFDDTTDESFSLRWVLPSGYQASTGITVIFRWKAAATSGAVGWCAQLVRVPDAATSDPALPAQAAGNCVSDTAKGTTLQENVATITNATCTSCVAGDAVNVVISRDGNGSAVTDSMTGDAKLLTVGRIWKVKK